MNEDTIIALATPPGVGAISVIRISGRNSFVATDLLFSGKTSILDAKSHTIHYGYIHDSLKNKIDDILVSVFRQPNSYTGEDCIEISTHGNPLIVQKIISEFINTGMIRLAEPGEFTKRAFLNNKLDLSQAEAVAEIIHARCDASLKGARNQLDGLLSNKISTIRGSLINLTSLVELELDFAEEDIEFIKSTDLLKKIEDIISELDNLMKSFSTGRIIRDGVNLVLVGKPNVGKSSILNYLLKESRAIVSEIPGTTRDIIREEIFIDGFLFRIYDTAGFRNSTNTIEVEGIKRSIDALKNADVVLFIEDISQGSSQDLFSEVLEYTSENKIIRVLNKIDLKEDYKNKNFDEVQNSIDVKISAKTGEGMSILTKKILQKTIGSSYYTEKTAIVTNIRHYNCIKNAKESLLSAKESILKKASGEFVSVDLRNANIHLSEIIGEVTNDDILNNIFSKFCIGK